MKRRIAAGPTFEVIPLPGAARMVTLTDPGEGLESAQDAFVRLDPPVGHPGPETASWRQRAAAVALAVRVLPTRRDADVPDAEARPRADRGSDVRAEAIEIARGQGGEELASLVDELFGSAS